MKARYTLAAAIAAALLSAGGATAGTLITGAKIKDGTVTSRDIKDGSLLAADFKTGQLPAGRPGRDGVNGRDGAPGQPGPQGPAPSGMPRVTALPDIAMKPDDPARPVATVGPFSYRMSCSKLPGDLFTEFGVDGSVTLRTATGVFFWTFQGGAAKALDGAPPFAGYSTDTSGPGYDAWTTTGEVARVIGDFAVNAGGCTLSNAKVYVWG
jgi:hypothetical protein